MVSLVSSEVRQLLHNKFVVILGDSIQRTVYKDLVLLLQKDSLLTHDQLKAKGELSFEKDELVKGGQRGPMCNGTQYREVRQFCSGHHLVRFYFLTRVYSEYLEAILKELLSGKDAPDVFIMNSCLWDLSRYGQNSWRSYRENLESLFRRLNEVLPEQCLLVWNTTMPVGEKITGGFFLPEHQPSAASLRVDVVKANFYSSAEACKHDFDVLDLHFHFRRSQHHRQRDGVHWNEFAHRHLSQLLLAHVADAWGVELPHRDPSSKWIKNGRVRESAGHQRDRQPQASKGELALLPPSSPPPPMRLHHCRPLPPLLRPTPPLTRWPMSSSFPQPHPMPLHQEMPQFPPNYQDSYFFSNQPLQSDQFSFDCFHLDVPLPTHRGFVMEGNFMFGPQPPMPLFSPPCYQQRAPVVHRSFPRYRSRGPYVHGRRRPRPSKRLAPTHPESRP
ncbi:PC-esterase domain-containing protein 1B [Elephas maximus indicus]|uniref:PC-esterase domain-containing protein 1B n=1 Tax=Elephas maximus indicus TaxID=99487 RepID=UPI0021163555|nr:PC-esterase domain-containing protein 1B [Elephas maximus indicus]XP_049738875.1 PC-esterase domain-containing protein 1B [Elephas maximus indicus]XP_049738876.1 PC-esterase domain-containing protein 1B [Elephas maximus indicus]